MDSLQALLVAIPSVASILATVVSVLVSLKRVKEAVGDTKETSKQLKVALKEKDVQINQLYNTVVKNVVELQDDLKIKGEELKVLVAENETLKETVKKLEELLATEKTIKAQLTALLNKGE